MSNLVYQWIMPRNQRGYLFPPWFGLVMSQLVYQRIMPRNQRGYLFPLGLVRLCPRCHQWIMPRNQRGYLFPPWFGLVMSQLDYKRKMPRNQRGYHIPLGLVRLCPSCHHWIMPRNQRGYLLPLGLVMLCPSSQSTNR
jgi:hypothetical protein